MAVGCWSAYQGVLLACFEKEVWSFSNSGEIKIYLFICHLLIYILQYINLFLGWPAARDVFVDVADCAAIVQFQDRINCCACPECECSAVAVEFCAAVVCWLAYLKNLIFVCCYIIAGKAAFEKHDESEDGNAGDDCCHDQCPVIIICLCHCSPFLQHACCSHFCWLVKAEQVKRCWCYVI